MSLSQRVREFRYLKGWGPDELASRAEISRTALYQIESGKTELPRAGTLRRIAHALEISIDDLMGLGATPGTGKRFPHPRAPGDRGQEARQWYPDEGTPLALPPTRRGSSPHGLRESSFAVPVAGVAPGRKPAERPGPRREGDLTLMLHELLSSPLGEGIARIIEEAHQLLVRDRFDG